ncbi:hypothetical protein CF392_15915 [Tamilnaduibacter salinus]|uniref:Uncharacterized protein n=1 Tax=Tamilnaduibacter salinus TaxID=1484056 RepID=A0A2A2HZ10_9GAMM|nr:hypothetical protein CF392_15915 [Tamilnaduibacter salinus]
MTTPEAQLSEAESALEHLDLPVNGETVHRVNKWDLFNALLASRSLLKTLLGKNKRGAKFGAASTTFKSAPEGEGQDTTSGFQRLKDFIYNLCYFPDQAGPWILPAVFRGLRIIKQHRIDAIFATGAPGLA